MIDRPWILNFDSAPFCNGSLHLGHVRNHVLGDIRTRWLRSRGVDVEYRTQFDAFGVPHEAAAEAASLPTHEYVTRQIRRMEAQLGRLNLSFSTHDHLRTCEPDYYRWTQWLFLFLWRIGRIYMAAKPVRYCDACQTFLANTQCVGNACWRCGNQPQLRNSTQFFVRTSDYLERLHDGIDDLAGWSLRARKLLRSFMGRQSATLSQLCGTVDDASYTISAFGPPIDRTHDLVLLLRRDHPLALSLTTSIAPLPPRRRVSNARPKNPPLCVLDVDGTPIPVFVSLGDEFPADTDALLLPPNADRFPDAPKPHFKVHLRSTTPAVRFRLGDWMVSRNREWGTPIPLVDCASCGIEPMVESALPLLLPAHGGGELATCSTCLSEQPRVAGTLDCFFDDAWSFWSASRTWSRGEDSPFEFWRSNPPTEVHFHAGYDSFVYLHLYRFLGHVLFDNGVTHRAEPIDYYHGHDVITAGGRKMSKRHGNTPDFDQLLDEYGPDVVRLAIVGRSNPGKAIEWNTDLLSYARHALATARELAATVTSPSAARQPLRIPRLDRFISEYRIASAVDALYVQSTRLLKSKQPNVDLARALTSYWLMIAPATTVSTSHH